MSNDLCCLADCQSVHFSVLLHFSRSTGVKRGSREKLQRKISSLWLHSCRCFSSIEGGRGGGQQLNFTCPVNAKMGKS